MEHCLEIGETRKYPEGEFRERLFTRRHRWIAYLSQRTQGLTYTSRHGLTRGLRRKGGLGFVPVRSPESSEETFLRGLDFSKSTVYDIGGFQGLMTLFFAKTARQVITYEANPANALRIHENAKLNRFENVLVRNMAVGANDGILQLQYDPLMSGAASGDPDIAGWIARSDVDAQHFSVAMTSLDEDVERLGLMPPDFVKIDIEGMELEALKGMQRLMHANTPALYIELHGTTEEHKLANARETIGFVRSNGYDVYDVERAAPVTTVTGRESRIYCIA